MQQEPGHKPCHHDNYDKLWKLKTNTKQCSCWPLIHFLHFQSLEFLIKYIFDQNVMADLHPVLLSVCGKFFPFFGKTKRTDMLVKNAFRFMRVLLRACSRVIILAGHSFTVGMFCWLFDCILIIKVVSLRMPIPINFVSLSEIFNLSLLHTTE